MRNRLRTAPRAWPTPAISSTVLRVGELLVPSAGQVRAAAGLICIALVSASSARARDSALPRLELHWDAPDNCLDHDSARDAIEAALGASAAQAKTHAVVRVRISQVDDDRWSADIWMYDETGGGERSFDGATCTQVAQAAVMIVAFALDETRAAEPASQSADSAAVPKHDEHDRARFGVGVRARGDIGSLPAVDAGMALVLEARYRRFGAEVEGSAWLPQITYSGPVSGSGGEFALYTGGLRGCFDLLGHGATWIVGPCAGAEAGMTTGSGVGVTERRSSRVFWATGLLGTGLRFLGGAPLEVGLLAEIGVPFHRAAWQLDDFGPVFQPAPVIGRASLGLSYLFP
jgi:hypothetical protein